MIAIKKYPWLLLFFAALIIVSCSKDDNGDSTEEELIVSAGEADFSKFVAVGNSLTAGYTDGALFIESQLNSFPNILAGQFALAGGGEFNQPLMNDNLGGLLLGGNVIAENRLFFNGSGPERLPGVPTTEVSQTLSGNFNNMGVPGAKVYHLLAPGYGNVAGVPTGQANPYFARFASSPNTTLLADAVAQQPTFFTLWIGNNDVLGYASSGGAGVNQAGNMDPSTYETNDITDPTVFTMAYTTIVDNLTANGAKGAVANIPNVLTTAYFTTVPYNPLNPADPNYGPMIPLLNNHYASINQVFQVLGVPERSIVFHTDQASAVVIHDEYLTDLSEQITNVMIAGGVDPTTATLLGQFYGQARQANSTDLMVLPSMSAIGQLNQTIFDMLIGLGVPAETAAQLSVNGLTFPLEDKWVLVDDEQLEIANTTALFNGIIQDVATQKGLAFVDAHAILDEIATVGVDFDEFSLNGSLVFGGLFSLDGIHPTARGAAYIANRFIESINETYQSTLPYVKARDYVTIFSPNLP